MKTSNTASYMLNFIDSENPILRVRCNFTQGDKRKIFNVEVSLH